VRRLIAASSIRSLGLIRLIRLMYTLANRRIAAPQ
jgi:hypothetical protein